MTIIQMTMKNDVLRLPKPNLNDIVQKTLWYIRCNFRKKITLQSLGDRVGYTPNHLALMFKNSVGISCMTYIRQLRLRYAIDLLNHTSLSVESIAQEAGFSSVSYFIATFHKETGKTPNEYRQKQNSIPFF